MADDDGRTVESFDGLLEHILRRHVEVVGRLIEDEQVDRFQQQTDHGQTGTLSAGEHTDLFLRDLTTKHEGAEQVVDLQTHLTRGHTVDGVVDGQTLIEQLCLVLREVANLDVVRNLQRTGEGNLSHDALNERGLTLTVLSDKGYLLATLDGHVDMGEDGVSAIVLAHVVADDRIVATAQTRRELEVHDLVVDIIDLDGHNLLKLTDALLHLHSLGGLIAEALDKRLGVGDLLLLVLISTQLLLATLLAEHDILIVLHLVVFDMAAGDLQRAVGDVVDEGAVVADEDHGTGALSQELLEPLNRLDVEVVGGLVEKEHVGMLEKNLRQLNAHTPTTGKLARRPVEIAAFKAQSGERALHLSLVVLSSHHHIALMGLGELINQGHVVFTLIISALGHLLLHLVELLLDMDMSGESLSRFLAHGSVILKFHHLWQIAHGRAVGHRHRT